MLRCCVTLHVEIDQNVSDAIRVVGHGPRPWFPRHEARYSIHDRPHRYAKRVLDRLLELNHQRYAEEVAQGLHEKHTAKARRGPAQEEQKGLLKRRHSWRACRDHDLRATRGTDRGRRDAGRRVQGRRARAHSRMPIWSRPSSVSRIDPATARLAADRRRRRRPRHGRTTAARDRHGSRTRPGARRQPHAPVADATRRDHRPVRTRQSSSSRCRQSDRPSAHATASTSAAPSAATAGRRASRSCSTRCRRIRPTAASLDYSALSLARRPLGRSRSAGTRTLPSDDPREPRTRRRVAARAVGSSSWPRRSARSRRITRFAPSACSGCCSSARKTSSDVRCRRTKWRSRCSPAWTSRSTTSSAGRCSGRWRSSKTRFRARNREQEMMAGLLRIGVPDYSERAFREAAPTR